MGLDGVELILAIEEEFQIAISDAEASESDTVEKVVDMKGPKRFKRNTISITATSLLSFLSFWIVVTGATDEPYGAISRYDVISQIGVPSVLITGWVIFMIWQIVNIVRDRQSSFWLFAILWGLIVLFYLIHCPMCILSDLEQMHGVKFY